MYSLKRTMFGMVCFVCVMYWKLDMKQPLATKRSKEQASVINQSISAINVAGGEAELQQTVADCGEHEHRCKRGSLTDALLVESRHSFMHIADQAYVFSAYYDDRVSDELSVRGIGYGPASDVICILWYDFKHCDIVTAATDEHSRFTKGVDFICNVTEANGKIPRYVTFTTRSHMSNAVDYAMQIEHTPVGNRFKHNMTVCMHNQIRNGFSNSYLMTEFVEVYEMLGVSNFILYNHSGSSTLKPAMDYYVEQGIMHVSQLPDPHTVSISRYDRQHLVIQECIYRSMYTTKHLVLVDMDEFVFPTNHTTILEMLEAGDADRCAAVRLYLYDFNIDLPKDPDVSANSTITALSSTTLLYTARKQTSCCHKYIIVPSRVAKGSVHKMEKYVSNEKVSRCRLQERFGYIHHFRSRGLNTTNVVVDHGAHRFRDQIVKRLTNVQSVLKLSL